MNEEKKILGMDKRKFILICLIAAAVILIAALTIVLISCAGGIGKESGSGETTAAAGADDYILYWNVDREKYAGQDATGMSSREPNPDTGYFQVTFAMEGRQGIRRVKERRIVNKIDNMELMGLVLDENGIISDVLSVEELTGGYAVNRFYVESFDDNKVLVNSSDTLKGMQVELELNSNTKIYDVSGETGDIGCATGLFELDCIVAIQNSKGEITHIYVVEREPQGPTKTHYCDHCKQEVTWRAWMYENSLPTGGAGHYYIYNDINLSGQMSMSTNSEIVLDLNGKTVNSSGTGRMYSLHNEGCYLGLMDYSEEKTGKFVLTGKISAQGGCVWIRYGKFEMWGGTLDGSKCTNQLSGVVVEIGGADRVFNMYGGTIIGGTAEAVYNKAAGTVSAGLGGAVMNWGQFNMSGGTITGGKAKAVYNDKKKTYNNGCGGNVGNHNVGAVFTMTGGTIKGGVSDNEGGNIWNAGGATVNIQGGTISGGKVARTAVNGGNVYNSGTLNISGGTIKDGETFNCAGNIYSSNKLNISGGHITGGKWVDFETKEKSESNNGNVFVVNGITTISGGKVDGYFQLIPFGTTNKCDVTISGNPVIDGAIEGKSNLLVPPGTLLKVGKMTSGAKVSVNASGVFSEKTDEANKKYFKIDHSTTPVGYAGGCLCVGEVLTKCICGMPDGKNHVDGCDKEELAWNAWSNSGSLPTSGNWYLIKDVNVTTQTVLKNTSVNLSLNGYNITQKGYNRVIQLQTSSTLKLTNWGKTTGGEIVNTNGYRITENSDAWTKQQGGDSGAIIFTHNYAAAGEEKKYAPNLYIYDVSLIANKGGKAAQNITLGGAVGFGGGGFLGIYEGAELIGAPTRDNGGTLYVDGGTVDMRGGTIVGTEALFSYKLKDYSAAEPEYLMNGTNKVGYGGNGGAVGLLGAAKMTMTGGTIKGGKSNIGGNVAIFGNAALYMKGGTITGGDVDTSIKNEGNHGGNIYVGGLFEMSGGTVEKGTAVDGGNFSVNGGNAVVRITGGTVKDGVVEKQGGNFYIFYVGCKEFTMSGGTVSGGQAGYDGGNFCFSVWAANADRTFNFTGGTVTGGVGNFGGNFIVSSSNDNGKAIKYVFDGAKVTKGVANGSGGNIYMQGKADVTIKGSTVFSDGEAKGTWSPENAKHSGVGGNIAVFSGTVNYTSGTIKDGIAGSYQGYAGGNVAVNGADAKFVMDGANTEISGGKVRSGCKCKGGNIGINNGEFVLKNGKIHDGMATDCSGNIHVCSNGTFTIEGGYVYNGKITEVKYTDSSTRYYNTGTANIYVVNGTLNLYGGWIDGYVSMVGYSIKEGVACTLQLKGSPKVKNIGTAVSGITDATPDATTSGMAIDELKVNDSDTVYNVKSAEATGTLTGTGNIFLLHWNQKKVAWVTGTTNIDYFTVAEGYQLVSKSDGLYFEAIPAAV